MQAPRPVTREEQEDDNARRHRLRNQELELSNWLLSVATKGAIQPQASSATIQPDSIHRPTPRLSELALPTGVPSPTELPYDGSIPFYLPGTALSPPKDSPADEDSPQASNSSHTPTVAQPILTKEQRKANHVDSEKRRRAGIRQSYEALCLIVPSLREAMDEEEADIQKSKKGKKAEEADNKPSKRLTKGQVSKSEGIVLQHTVDYLNQLEKQRESLKFRMEQVKARQQGNSWHQ